MKAGNKEWKINKNIKRSEKYIDISSFDSYSDKWHAVHAEAMLFPKGFLTNFQEIGQNINVK